MSIETEERTGLNTEENTDSNDVDLDNSEELNTDNADEGNDNSQQKEELTGEFYGAPETYDFKDLNYPDGIKMDEALAKEFAPLGKELNLSQQGANKLAQLLIEYQQKQLVDAPKKIAEFKKQEAVQTKLSYEKMLREDKEIGGGDETKMNAYIDVADVGYDNFASNDLKNLLHSLSLDFHPAVIKHFHRLGKLCGEDSIAKTGQQKNDLTPAQILYGNSNKEND